MNVIICELKLYMKRISTKLRLKFQIIYRRCLVPNKTIRAIYFILCATLLTVFALASEEGHL